MRFAPTATEVATLHEMQGPALLEYFVTRVAEGEEIWGLGDKHGWVMHELEDCDSLPVWPYQQMASDCATGAWSSQRSKSMSLEHFLSSLMKLLIQQNIQIEIMPTPSSRGFIVDAKYLNSLFESILDSSEYFLEG